MDKADELERLRQHAQGLEHSIDAIDGLIEAATQDLAAHEASARLISYLRERHNAQLGFMYDLGKVQAQIERLESLQREDQERPEEQVLAAGWEERQPIAQEDHLDWFKQSLSENPPQLAELDRAEQQMLQEMEREPVPEDHLDWLSGSRRS